MRLYLLLLTLCLPTFSHAEDRFGDWVASQLGFAPFYAQSIGWDMPETSVTISDPLSETDTEVSFLETPPTTAWVVGIFNEASDARLSGFALVWSDGPFDRVAPSGIVQTQSGYVAFQTPKQTWVSIALPEKIAAQMIDLSPGPILTQQPDGTVFPVGDSGVSGSCFEASALYKDNDELIALVVLFKSNARVDADASACIALTS